MFTSFSNQIFGETDMNLAENTEIDGSQAWRGNNQNYGHTLVRYKTNLCWLFFIYAPH